jgi:hypothetical protein
MSWSAGKFVKALIGTPLHRLGYDLTRYRPRHEFGGTARRMHLILRDLRLHSRRLGHLMAAGRGVCVVQRRSASPAPSGLDRHDRVNLRLWPESEVVDNRPSVLPSSWRGTVREQVGFQISRAPDR